LSIIGRDVQDMHKAIYTFKWSKPLGAVFCSCRFTPLTLYRWERRSAGKSVQRTARFISGHMTWSMC